MPLGAISNNTKLTFFSIENNRISHALVNEMFPASLKFLYVGSNKITGALPNLSHLKNFVFSAWNNPGLQCPVPDFDTVNTLDLDDCHLACPLPNFWRNAYLYSLSLTGNNFFGNITLAFVNNTLLEVVYLADNKLTGFPLFHKEAIIYVLVLSANLLSGEVRFGPEMHRLNTLDLSKNALEGDCSMMHFVNFPVIVSCECGPVRMTAKSWHTALSFHFPSHTIIFFQQSHNTHIL